jgi:hypothetical protein
VTRLDGGYTGNAIGRTNHLVGTGANGFTFTPGPRF